ncbi:MAG: hypothetical protein WBK91_02250 [Alphaproteobacteria bacterium]
MAKNVVLGIVHTHANRILHNATEMYCQSIRHHGYDAMTVDIADPQWVWHLGERLKNGDVAFAFGIQGVGSRLEADGGVNLWTAARTPFLCLHHDNPCYNPANHSNDSPFVANFYFFPSFLETKNRYLPSAQIAALLPYELLQVPPASQRAFAARPIRLLFLKTGATLDEPERQLHALIPRVRDAAFDQLRRACHDPNLLLGALVQEIFDREKLDRGQHHNLFWGLAQVMDTWLRRRRAIDFVNWLKFQPGAVIIGDGWDAIDRTGARAEFSPSTTSWDTVSLYEQAQFICNTNPYGGDIVHERILYGMALGGCVISDGNAVLDQVFGATPALTRFDWQRPLDEQLLGVIGDLAAAEAAAQTGRQAVMAQFGPKNMVGMIVDGARQMTAALEQIAG